MTRFVAEFVERVEYLCPGIAATSIADGFQHRDFGWRTAACRRHAADAGRRPVVVSVRPEQITLQVVISPAEARGRHRWLRCRSHLPGSLSRKYVVRTAAGPEVLCYQQARKPYRARLQSRISGVTALVRGRCDGAAGSGTELKFRRNNADFKNSWGVRRVRRGRQWAGGAADPWRWVAIGELGWRRLAAVHELIELSGQTVAIAGNNAIACHPRVNENGGGVGKWSVSKIGVVRQKRGADGKRLARQAFKVWSPLRTRAMP